MEYDICKLDTINSLALARELMALDVKEPFTFNARMDWVRPFGMLYTASALKWFRGMYPSIPFNMNLNLSKSCITYAGHMGFFKAISEKIQMGKLPGEAYGNSNYIPILEINFEQMLRDEIAKGNYSEFGEMIEKESARLALVLTRQKNELHSILTYLIREILRNIADHSEQKRAWVCGQYWSDNTAEVAILDEGIGIRNSLRRNKEHKKYIKQDDEAIKWAIKAGISQAFNPRKKNRKEDIWSNSGFGLYMVNEICKELRGSFTLATGERYLNRTPDGNTRYGDTNFQGTAVRIGIPTNEITNGRDIIQRIAKQGEEQAKLIRNAFKQASTPSKGLITDL